MPRAQYRLVVRQGPVPGQIFELNKNEITIGRDISNDFVINDAEVSRKHARLTLEEDRYKIEDLNSTNGTYIDGQRLIGPHVMAVGEIIMFGDNVGVIYDGEPTDPNMTIPSRAAIGNTPVAAIPAPQEETYAAPEVELYPIPEQESLEEELEPIVEESRKPANSWLLACGGCAVVILLLIIAVAIVVDQMVLYCEPPFNIIFGALGYCP